MPSMTARYSQTLKNKEIVKVDRKSLTFRMVTFEHMFECFALSMHLTGNTYLQEVFHVYLNKFENAVTHLFLVILGNN